MRIAVIGTGNIGRTLGTKWRAAGHEVVYGARTTSADGGPAGAAVLPVADALASADVVLLAVPGAAAGEFIRVNGAALDGKVVIDAANNIGADVVNNRAAVQASAPGAKYARAFNTLGWENFEEPPDGAVLFFAADPEARSAAQELISATGLAPSYVGNASAAGIVDGVVPLWFALVHQQGGNRKLAFRVVR
jgi:8-hydroxy-5-deazaflavin:NADPH oxidoreductase